ncbi:glycosyltransferase [Pelagibacterales bacterium]|nr:glycosyltransferase [Pelagibacterales bacterium]
MTEPKVSIITSIFNNKTFIGDSIKSVLSQSYQNIEYIIIDGGSKDGSQDIINTLITNETIFISEQDEGIYNALNKGINLASGEIIGILHSDDLFENSDVVKDIVDNFITYNADITYSDLLYISKKNKKKIIRRWKAGEFQYENLKHGWMLPHTTLFLKKEVYLNFGLFNEVYEISSDYDLMIRILKSKKLVIKYIPKYHVLMRVGGKSNNSIYNIIRKMTEDYRIIKKNQIGGIMTLVKKNINKISQFF